MRVCVCERVRNTSNEIVSPAGDEDERSSGTGLTTFTLTLYTLYEYLCSLWSRSQRPRVKMHDYYIVVGIALCC